jgi:hypothetical protein
MIVTIAVKFNYGLLKYMQAITETVGQYNELKW